MKLHGSPLKKIGLAIAASTKDDSSLISTARMTNG